MTTEALKLDAYIRVSRVGGRSGESFISPGVQREQIEGWAKAHAALVTWHEPELDASGGTTARSSAASSTPASPPSSSSLAPSS
jgi:hypothetical protein